jgi:hypothetical protein
VYQVALNQQEETPVVLIGGVVCVSGGAEPADGDAPAPPLLRRHPQGTPPPRSRLPHPHRAGRRWWQRPSGVRDVTGDGTRLQAGRAESAWA